MSKKLLLETLELHSDIKDIGTEADTVGHSDKFVSSAYANTTVELGM